MLEENGLGAAEEGKALAEYPTDETAIKTRQDEADRLKAEL